MLLSLREIREKTKRLHPQKGTEAVFPRFHSVLSLKQPVTGLNRTGISAGRHGFRPHRRISPVFCWERFQPVTLSLCCIRCRVLFLCIAISLFTCIICSYMLSCVFQYIQKQRVCKRACFAFFTTSQFCLRYTRPDNTAKKVATPGKLLQFPRTESIYRDLQNQSTPGFPVRLCIGAVR